MTGYWTCSIVVLALVGIPSGLRAQALAQTDVNLEVPLNLTNLSPVITKVRVECSIRSTANLNGAAAVGKTEVPVVDGKVVQTLKVTVTVAPGSIPDFEVGKTATWACALGGYNGSAWGSFSENLLQPAFYLKPSASHFLAGQFVW